MADLRYPFTDDGVCSALKALGTTANAVATNLSSMGYRGRQHRSEACPVSNYLVGCVDSAEFARVDQLVKEPNRVVVQVRSDIHWCDGIEDHRPVAEFIRQFDLGLFPDLIEDEDPPEELEVSHG